MPPRRKKSSKPASKKNAPPQLDVPFEADWESCNPRGYPVTWNPAGTTPGVLTFSVGNVYRPVFSDKSTPEHLEWVLEHLFQYPIGGISFPKSKLLTPDAVGDALSKLPSVRRINLLGKEKTHWQAGLLLPEVKQVELDFPKWTLEQVAETLQRLPKSSEFYISLNETLNSLKLEPILSIPVAEKITVRHTNYRNQKCEWVGLSQQKDLKTLEIEYGDLGKTLWPELAELPNLENIRLQWPESGSGDRKKPVALPKLKAISMSCYFSPVPDLFHMLAPSPNLEILKIDQLRLDDDSATGIGKMQSLKDVYLWNTPFTDNGMKQMCRWPDIRKLVLAEESNSPTPVTDAGFAPLGKLKTLEMLQLQGFEGVSQKGWSALKGLTRLKKFRVSCDTSFDGMAAIGPLPSLEHLSNDGGRFLQDEGCEVLKDCEHLSTLFLSHSGMNPPPIPFEGISRINQLRFLQLNRIQNLNNDNLKLLTRLSNLEELVIEEASTINDKGIASLVQLTKLKFLSLVAVPKMNDNALKHISEIATLESLEIRANSKITEVGYSHLMNCKKLKNLSLTYAKNLTGDAILELVQHHKLERLTISRCTDFTEDHLQQLIACDFLKRLELGEGLGLSYGATQEAVKVRPEWGGYSGFWKSTIRFY